MAKERHDVAVVGAGIMGAATAATLAARGCNVVLIEQHAVGHARGSSHGRSRIFRFSYPDPVYVDMAREALALWRAVEERAGKKLLHITGGLDIGDGIEDNARALEAAGAEFELAGGQELKRRFPFLSFDDDVPVLFSPDSGTIAADTAVRTFVALARADGCRVIEGLRVQALAESEPGVTLTTDDGVIEADVVVVAAGGWAKELLATAGISLPVWVTRETVAYFPLDATPPTLVDWGAPTVYALPSPGQGLKAGRHIAGPTVDPDEQGDPDLDSIAVVSEWVRRHYPSAAEPMHAETCLYTNTDDQRFILERHGRVIVGSPCSGHGFKFAPLIGRRLADLARER